ncbi:putative iron-regulated membrane protein [Flavobacterium sp. HSC-32F16]|uniref:PepSY-associated TM helix domain-containing protein n=1 Tax=Flavobacterium sp. HSC-32F16 TaxID=2910964 RepID=UPI0020A39DB6|nr:PepSY-associated TM helix domain-containing protein [Flavobacterium sp. HSC-32F16]MCP2028515.1 putative iron-regulated membrane protein [Flavobacterium sp. HSC-32F16]
MRKILNKIHLWLGLTSGLVVFISMLAASIFVWDEELTAWYHNDKIFVTEIKNTVLPLDSLTAVIRQKYPSADYAIINKNPGKSYVFTSYEENIEPHWTAASDYKNYSNIYIDQYTGKELGEVDLRYDWIFNLRLLHQNLLLTYDVGHYLVGFSTLIIFILILTGIYLWWPKNKAALKQRVWFRWKSTTKWKRKNYDFHNIGGIYTFVFILIFAITGLVWTFDWWTNGIYRILGNDPEKVWDKAPEISKDNAVKVQNPLEYIVKDTKVKIPNWTSIGLSLPENTAKNAVPVTTFVRHEGNSGWDESDSYTYNSLSAENYFKVKHHNKSLGAKWRNSNYAIHTGSIYGFPTKVLASFISLFCALLPVSGFLIWWGRNKKKRL